MYELIRDAITKVQQTNELISLVHKLSDISGFFVRDGKLFYIVKNMENLETERTETEFLTFSSNVFITAVENHAQFESGYYNTIKYKGDSSNDNFEGFINLCLAHASSQIKINIDKFFYSLISLFQLPKDQQFKNLIGLFGELKFIEYVYSHCETDISTNWHKNGSQDKYDFVCPNNNFEVKTIKSEEQIVKIKHSQIFNCDINHNYLVVIQLEDNISGESLIDLIKKLGKMPPFDKCYNFQLNIEREKRRVSREESHKFKFKVLSIKIYLTSKIETIKNIPENITQLEYIYNFGNIASEKIKKVFK